LGLDNKASTRRRRRRMAGRRSKRTRDASSSCRQTEAVTGEAWDATMEHDRQE
jgi:hypothetical protein